MQILTIYFTALPDHISVYLRILSFPVKGHWYNGVNCWFADSVWHQTTILMSKIFTFYKKINDAKPLTISTRDTTPVRRFHEMYRCIETNLTMNLKAEMWSHEI